MRRRALALVCVVGAVAIATAAGCGGDDEGATPDTTVTEVTTTTETETTETTETETTETETTDTETETEAETETETVETGTPETDAAAGRALFADNGCGTCHTLADADATGSVGPSLDESAVDQAAAETQIRDGGGGMPPFGDSLSDDEIETLAAYVVEARSS